ncbi:helix-turn-helix domain-containing protein [uncultured Pseudoramibacter sp.]|uniref:helix-turn-helix domain-containing protein n=1 Tax=uncultured Pseudoramibacter sp. TaxID=1623493 RepID=UPI0025E00F8C|nr:helix-turn-helix domain-containing protein [uncultured Pseudoramibacter sp.]
MAKSIMKEWTDEAHLTLLKECKRKGMTDAQIAKEIIGISNTTLYSWKKKNVKILNALKKGKDFYEAEAVFTLIDTFKGHYVDEEREEIWADGEGKLTSKHKVVTKRWIEPNMTAIIFYLKSQAGWRDKDLVQVDDNEEVQIVDDI